MPNRAREAGSGTDSKSALPEPPLIVKHVSPPVPAPEQVVAVNSLEPAVFWLKRSMLNGIGASKKLPAPVSPGTVVTTSSASRSANFAVALRAAAFTIDGVKDKLASRVPVPVTPKAPRPVGLAEVVPLPALPYSEIVKPVTEPVVELPVAVNSPQI